MNHHLKRERSSKVLLDPFTQDIEKLTVDLVYGTLTSLSRQGVPLHGSLKRKLGVLGRRPPALPL